jgi:beta-glucosidase
VPLGDDLDAVVATTDGHVKAETAQVNVQQDARRIALRGRRPVLGVFDDGPGLRRLRGHARRAGLRPGRRPGAGRRGARAHRLRLSVRRLGRRDEGVAALPLHAKATLKIPLQCFADQGVDFAAITVPFAIDTAQPFVASFANIRWQVGADKRSRRAALHARPK